jgi:PPK2 family polyphosphate:nucleotide phosphotransferase
MTKIKVKDFLVEGKKKITLSEINHTVPLLYDGKKDYQKQIKSLREEIDERQRMMYAHDRYALLCVFQAMDAAGKDSTIRAVFSGVNPHGLQVTAFKKPSDEELDHNYLWRTTKAMPERGRIGVFNRSYYEEVLVVRVHPEILTHYQRLPKESVEDLQQVWTQRYEAIRNFEHYAHQNGTRVLKFFLNVSKQEQRDRFVSRIDEAEKNWKFSEADVKERGYWDDYMQAYEDCINHTATTYAPWHIIPADDKRNMRLIVSHIVLDMLKRMDVHYPKVSKAREEALQAMRSALEADR